MSALLTSQASKEALELARGLFLHRDLVTEKLNVLGQSGGGKTYTAMKLAELMLSILGRIFVFDLVGAWNGLLSSADGLRPGFPITVIGGERGHLPLNAGAGRLIADIAFDRDISVVCDLSRLFAEDEAAVHTFVADCLQQLFKRHQQHKKRRHLFFEEAQELFPQEGPTKEQFRCRRIGTTVCKLGRNFGLGYTTISQEPQSVSKRILNQAGTLIAVRTIGENERKAINGTVRSKELDLMNVLPTLTTGEALVWSPAWLKFSGRVRILPKVTFDSSRTPEEGEELVEPKVLATVELEQLRAAMADAIAEVEATDPSALQRRVRQLEAELAARPPPAPPERIEVPVFTENDRGILIEVEHQVLSLNRTVRELMETTRGFPDKTRPTVAAAPVVVLDNVPEHMKRAAAQPKPWAVEPPAVNVGEARIVRAKPEGEVPPQNTKLAAGPQKLFAVLARAHPRPITRAQLALLSGFAKGGGAFRTYLPKLRTEGLIDYVNGDQVALSSAGVAQAAGITGSNDETIAEWARKLGPSTWKLFEELLGAHPRRMTRGQLAASTGFAKDGGAFRTYLPKLRTAGLVDYDGDEVLLTPHALELLGDRARKPAKSHAEIVASWRERLQSGPRMLLDAVLAAHPTQLSRAELAAKAGFEVSGGAFRTYLPKLRTLGLIDYVGEAVKASEALWP